MESELTPEFYERMLFLVRRAIRRREESVTDCGGAESGSLLALRGLERSLSEEVEVQKCP